MRPSKMKYRSHDEPEWDAYTVEEIEKHAAFKRSLVRLTDINFLDFPVNVRNRIYGYALRDAPSPRVAIDALRDAPSPCVAIETWDTSFHNPHPTTKLNLALMQVSKQVNEEFTEVLFSQKFYFHNPDLLLAFLAKSSEARRYLRHVDLRLVAGRQGLEMYALQALSELFLDTLTLRCDPVRGNEEDWKKSPEMRMLLKTRGINKVTLAAVKDTYYPIAKSWLSANDLLGRIIITQLERPAPPFRRDPSRISVMPDTILEPEGFHLRKSLTNFRGLEEKEALEVLMLDPLCRRHEGLLWCHCITRKQKTASNPENHQMHWSQLPDIGSMPSPP